MASFIKLSPSITVESLFLIIVYFLFTDKDFNKATTAIGSVQEIIDPNINAPVQVYLVFLIKFILK